MVFIHLSKRGRCDRSSFLMWVPIRVHMGQIKSCIVPVNNVTVASVFYQPFFFQGNEKVATEGLVFKWMRHLPRCLMGTDPRHRSRLDERYVMKSYRFSFPFTQYNYYSLVIVTTSTRAYGHITFKQRFS